MGNFCARSDPEDPNTVEKVIIGTDYQEFVDKIAGTGIKATPAWQATVTRAQLNNKREEFWRTRRDGNRRVWLAIKAAVEADPGTALSIIQNTKITLKKGNLTLLEDSEGNLYHIPIFMINNPISFHKEKKHKGRVVNTNQEQINIKIRQSGVANDEEVGISNVAKVSELKAKYCEKVGLQTSQIRLFYGGKEMKDNATLANLFIEDGVVIQVFVKEV